MTIETLLILSFVLLLFSIYYYNSLSLSEVASKSPSSLLFLLFDLIQTINFNIFSQISTLFSFVLPHYFPYFNETLGTRFIFTLILMKLGGKEKHEARMNPLIKFCSRLGSGSKDPRISFKLLLPIIILFRVSPWL